MGKKDRLPIIILMITAVLLIASCTNPTSITLTSSVIHTSEIPVTVTPLIPKPISESVMKSTETMIPSATSLPTLTPTVFLSPTSSPTAEIYFLGKIIDSTTSIGAVQFFDIAQDEGYDADKNDINNKMANALCVEGGDAWHWKQLPSLDLYYNTMDGHRGIDLYVPEGTVIYSPHDGSLDVRVDTNTIFIRTNEGFQSVIDHISPLENLPNYVKAGTQIATVTSKTTDGHMTIGGKVFHEFHYGLMIKNSSMSNGWQSIDPLFGPCSTSTSNPYGHTIFKQDDMPQVFWDLLLQITEPK